jgi:hypothetical protein
MGGALLLLHVGKTKNGYKLTVDPRYGPATILKGIHIIELAYGQYPLKLAGGPFSVSSVQVEILTISDKDCDTILDQWLKPEEDGMFIVKASTYPSNSRSRTLRRGKLGIPQGSSVARSKARLEGDVGTTQARAV